MTAPNVVAVGGGHGLAASLRAARRYAGDITAIVSVADDGGSSGRLREAFGIPAPGDLRRCLVALGDESSPWTQAFEHRFEAGELNGHAFGNLVIAGLAGAGGDFLAALEEAGRVLGAVGRVLPSTTEPVVLKAEVNGAWVEGQDVIQHSGGVSRVGLVPPDPPAPPAALDAIARADQVVIGPGSLYTSVLAAVSVPDVRQALAATRAQKVYVCNLREQVPETAGFDVGGHVDALRAHGVDADVVLRDPRGLPCGDIDVACVDREVARDDGAAHDPERLAAALADLLR